MARPQAYPDEPRFLGVVAGFLTFALLEKLSRGLAHRLGRSGHPAATDAAAARPTPSDDAPKRVRRMTRRPRQSDTEVARR